ncbi:MAG: Stp1/IreP family PP2C-type Ser/Thr phosphatase [Ilumatobacteraceae bacterium]|jgi:protein phosphatase|nr:Stp1/IreP family PP2C-type Ser/Thr phosphatase [Ilumatobacteraceae bacterium]
MKLVWGAASHVGMLRQQNEDAFIAEANVFAVADGMGGHNAGEVASALAIAGLQQAANVGFTSAASLVTAINGANETIHQASGGPSEHRGMGTTLTALVPLPDTDGEPPRVVVANVGDSRAYLWRGNELKQVSADHSYVQELLSEGLITAAEARTHPRRNIVTRALGIEGDVNADAWVLPMVVGDRYVLCSDGLVDEVDDDQIALILRAQVHPQGAANQLVQVANDNGGRDNITVVVVDIVDEVTAVAPLVEPHTTRPPRKFRVRLLVATAVIIVMAAGTITAVGSYARGGYFVGFDGRGQDARLVVFKGRTQQILWFNPTVQLDSGVRRQDVFPALADDIDDTPSYESLEKATAYVNSIRGVVDEQNSTEETGA